MSIRFVCDGCNTGFRNTRDVGAPAITGERTDGWHGAELPNEEFHWCRGCALIAFRAVKAAREAHLKAINPDGGK